MNRDRDDVIIQAINRVWAHQKCYIVIWGYVPRAGKSRALTEYALRRERKGLLHVEKPE